MMKMKIVNGFCYRKIVLFRTLCVAMMVALCTPANAQISYDTSNSTPVFHSTSSYIPQLSTTHRGYTLVGVGMQHSTSYGRTTDPLFGNSDHNTSTGFIPASNDRQSSYRTFRRSTSTYGRTSSYGNTSGVGASAPSRIPGRRNSLSDGIPGTREGEEDGAGYIWDGEEWVAIPNGALKVEDNISYVWNGSAWVAIDDQREPGTPVGDMPWLLLLLMLGGYAILRKRIVNSGE